MNYYFKELNIEKDKVDMKTLENVYYSKHNIHPISDEEKFNSIKEFITSIYKLNNINDLIKEIMKKENEYFILKKTDIIVPCPSSSCNNNCHPSSF